MADTNETAFAPAQRASAETLQRQQEQVRTLPYAAEFLDAAAAMVLILNSDRQIVFESRAFRELLHPDVLPPEDANENLIGQRFGEIVACVHAGEHAGGCGTTTFCKVCGAVQATLESIAGRESVRECRMRRKNKDGRIEPMDLRVWARPLDVDGERFTMFTVADISNEKRRQMLERIFFHDVLNTAGGVHGLARFLAETNLEEGQIRETADMLCCSSEQLIEEIQAHRTLAAAERKDLIPHPVRVELHSFLVQLGEAFSNHDVARQRTIHVSQKCEEVICITDKLLLRRVVLNLLKNALEASSAGETVTIDCWRSEPNVFISVLNSGIMAEDVKLQIFNRSFSTKGSGRGLGTYSARLLTEEYLRGVLTFESLPPHGTVFTIKLPVEWPENGQLA